MTKICQICDLPLHDGDDVVAIMVTKFRTIDSSVSYAVENPSKCIEIVHSECYDWDDYDDEHDGEQFETGD